MGEMKLFDAAPSVADLDSRGFTGALQAVLSAVLVVICFGSAVSALGWLTGVSEPPAEVFLPSRGGGGPDEYGTDLAWFLLLAGVMFGVVFAVLAVTMSRRAVRAFRQTSRKARPAQQRERHARRNRRKKGHAKSRPEPNRTRVG